MKNISLKKLIGFICFCLFFFCVSAFTLFLIDAHVWGWILLFILFTTFILFRFSTFWQKIFPESDSRKVIKLEKLLIYLLFICLLGVNNRLSRPELKVSYRGTLVREFIREAKNLPMMKGDGMLSTGAAMSQKESKWKAPKEFTYTKIDCGVPIELLKKNNSTSNKLIFQIHGGAYVIGMIDSYRTQAVTLSNISDGASVLNIDYRIAPEHIFPAALEDALKAWNWILENGWKPSDVTLIGDSAGGNLVLALCLKLRDEGKELPGKIICLSPWADLAGSGKSHTENLYKDPMFGKSIHSYKEIRNAQESEKIIQQNNSTEQQKKPMTALYAGNTDLHEPYLSPVFADYHDFPKMLIQVGTWEVLLSDSQTIYANAKKLGVDVSLEEYEGMYHVFQQAGTFIPEGKKAWKQIELFLKQ